MNHELRRARKQRLWSQAVVAEKAEISERTYMRWEQGTQQPRDYNLDLLCKAFGMSPEELGFKRDMLSDIQKETVSTSLLLSGDYDMDKKRRELLHLLNVAGAALFLPFPELDWEKIEQTFTRPSQLDEAGLRDLEAICTYYWSIFKVAFSKKDVLDGVLGQLKTFIGLIKSSHPASTHRRLCTLASNLSQLAGEIFFDMNEYDSAQSCYTFAASAAKEAKNHDLWACALVRHAFILIYSRQYHDALPLLQGAEKVAQQGDTSLATRYWVAAVSAEAYAGAGNLPACQKFLDLAEGVNSLDGSVDKGWLRFEGSRMSEQRGACFVKLKEPALAMPVLLEALTSSSLSHRRRGIIFTDLALASLQQGKVDQACFYANEVSQIALNRPSGVLIKGIYGLRTQLEPFAQTNAVKQLDQRINLLA